MIAAARRQNYGAPPHALRAVDRGPNARFFRLSDLSRGPESDYRAAFAPGFLSWPIVRLPRLAVVA